MSLSTDMLPHDAALPKAATTPSLIILYVDDPAKSVAFYRQVLGREPHRAFPTFSSFLLPGGYTLGLWGKAGVQPPIEGKGVNGEIAFVVPDAAAVKALHDRWQALGLAIAQPVTAMDFGPTFVALDPDGNRLRVCLEDE